MPRSKRTIIAARPARVAAGALILTSPAAALALDAQPSAAESSVQVQLASSRIRYGQRLAVSGNAGAQWGGRAVEIELRPGASSEFVALARVSTAADGSFTATIAPRSSGQLRVVAVPGAAQSSALSTAGAPAQGMGLPAPSSPRELSVGARLRVRRRSLAVLAGQDPTLSGRLLPARPGRLVVLLGERHRHWVRLAASRTAKRGRFTLRLPRWLTGSTTLRVRFPGDRFNARAWTAAGRVVVYQTAVASWYDDAGATACGFHARYGVANLSLPCGARVRFRYGSRSVTATVDDRGPYVAGRQWDLNQNTAAALGFSGVGSVWYSD